MIELIIASSGLGKTHHILEDIVIRRIDSKIIVVTPDQNSYNFESMLCENLDGTFDIDVVNLSRLYSKLATMLNLNINPLTDTNKYMNYLELIKRFEGKDNFLIKRVEQDIEFIKIIDDLLEELDEYGVSSDKLQEYTGRLEVNKDKFEDILDLYVEYKHILVENGDYSKQGYIESIIKNIEYLDLSEYIFYIDGYYNFSPVEYKVIELLMKKAKKVVLSVIGDLDRYTNFKLEHIVKSEKTKEKTYKFLSLESVRDDYNYSLDIYRKSHEVIAYINSILLKNKIENFKIITFYSDTKEKNYKLHLNVNGRHIDVESMKVYENIRFNNDELYYLQKEFVKLSKSNRFTANENVKIFEVSDIETEMKQLSRNISREIIENKYKLNDIAILYRDEVYEKYEYILNNFGLNVHIDKNKVATNNRVIKLLKNILNYSDENFKFHILNILKNNLVNFEAKLIKEIESGDNYTGRKLNLNDIEKILELKLVNALQDLTKEHFEDPIEEYSSNDLNVVKLCLVELAEQINKLKKKKNIKQLVKELFKILNVLGIEENLVNSIDIETLTLDELEERTINNQIFEKVTKILKELEEYKNDKIIYENFKKIFIMLIDKITYRTIPLSEDYIIMSKIDLSKVENKKVIFLVGMNKDILPKNINSKEILDDNTKYELSLFGIELSPSSKSLLIDEDFVAYIALTRAREKLYVSYSKSNSRYLPQKPSIYIETICRILDDTEDERIKKYSEIESEFNLKKIESYDVIGNDLTFYSQKELRYYYYKFKYMNLLNKEADKKLIYLNKLYDKVSLATKGANNFTKKSINNDKKTPVYSFSKLRRYEQNPYIYFVENILKIQAEKEFGLTPLLLGSVKHSILDDKSLLKYMSEKVEQGKSLSFEKVEEYIDSLYAEIKGVLQGIITKSSNKDIKKLKLIVEIQRTNAYISDKILEDLIKTVGIEIYYQILSGYKIYNTEKEFVIECTSNSVSLELENGRRITRNLNREYNIKDFKLRGIIDRIDEKNGSYLVVDYKSSKVDFSAEKFYNREISQLLVYMLAVLLLENIDVNKLQGVFYRELAKKNKDNKEYRLRGLINEMLLKESSISSDIIFVRTKKDGSPYANDQHKVYNAMEFENLVNLNIEYLYDIIEKIQNFEFNLEEVEEKYLFDYILGENITIEKEYEKIAAKDFKNEIFKM
ncbi:MAG: PD-(D/E)XK nuclease family protein [Gemella sp.]|nr:PD-(D/E)XK nuclease family protein [Gemella sp.]